MVTHIVMIKFKPNTKKEQILEIKSDIESLINTIKELKFMEVGINFSKEDRAMDLVLTSKFNTKEDLQIYAQDKSHLIVIEKIKKVANFTKVVDYINE